MFRFNSEDTLVFHVTLRNKSEKEIRYLPESFCVRVGNRLYSSPSVTPWCAATVRRQHGLCCDHWHARWRRNELSLKNEFKVLVTRLSPPPPVVTVTNAPVSPCSQFVLLKVNHETRDFLNFFKTKSGKLVCSWPLWRWPLAVQRAAWEVRQR